jgi:hypothetical protein
MTKIENLRNALVNGEELTAAQIRSRFGLANPTAAVHQLRTSGTVVYLNERKNSKGETVSKYRSGKPTRALIAAGYRALSAGF